MQLLSRKIKHFSARAGIIFLLLLTIACQNTLPYKGSLWRVTDPQHKKPEKSLYILGSVHGFSKPNTQLSAAINKAFNESEILLVENDPNYNKADIRQLLDTNLTLYVDAQTVAYLRSYFLEIGASDEQLQKILRMHPRAVFSFLESHAPLTKNARAIAIKLDGLNYPGVDAMLIEIAKTQRKEIVELETAKDIIEIWSINCPGNESYSKLLSTALDYLTGKKIVKSHAIKAYDALATGNTNDFLAWYNSQENQADAATKILQTCSNIPRNRFWLKSFLELVRNEKNVFAVVGIAHLLSQDNLISLLRKEGLLVEEVLH